MTRPMTVNCWDLTVLSDFGWVSNEESRRLNQMVQPNDKTSVQAVLQGVLVPYLEKSRYWAEEKERLRTTLKYFLTTGEFPVEDVFYWDEPAFRLPDEPLDYYRWAWEVLFGDEDYHLETLEGFVENNNRTN